MTEEKKHDLGEFMEEFVSEISEHIEDIEIETLKLESKVTKESLHKIFRKLHTIKGMSGFMGLQNMNNIAHETESFIIKLKSGVCEINGGSLDYIFKAADYIREICENLNNENDQEFQKKLKVFILEMTENKMKTTFNEQAKGKDLELEKDEKNLSKDIKKKTLSQYKKEKGLKNVYMKIKNTLENMMLKMAGIKKIITKDRRSSSNFVKKIKKISEVIIKNSNKKIKLTIESLSFYLNLEIEKKLKEIILHIVRNSVSHGIEIESERIRKNKEKIGKIKIKINKISESLIIEVEDDGKGIEKTKVLEKAISEKILKKDFDYSDETIIKTIFEPCFSTSKDIDKVSGRGIGMSVIKEETERLGGNVELENLYPNGLKVTLKFKSFFKTECK